MRHFFSAIADLFRASPSDWAASSAAPDDGLINPATGLPMIGGLDTAGNPFGIDMHSSSIRSSLFDHAGHHGSFGGHDAFGGHDSFGSSGSFGSSSGSNWD